MIYFTSKKVFDTQMYRNLFESRSLLLTFFCDADSLALLTL